MKVSILALTLDRYDETMKALDSSLNNAGMSYELLICDNGSKDQRVIEWIKSKNPHYARLNSKNEGIPKALNQMYLRCTGDFIVTLANDIVMPPNWLVTMVDYASKVKYCGFIGIYCVAGKPPLADYNGIKIHLVTPIENRIFSNIGFKREVIDKIGFYSEDFLEYGLDDSDFCERVNMAGFASFYIPNLTSQHIGHDSGQTSEYRKFKDECLKKNSEIFSQRCAKRLAAIKEPLPELRESI